ncbi:MAG: nuclear transport factor 2 family protein [Gammaproteobacteria bacterium]
MIDSARHLTDVVGFWESLTPSRVRELHRFYCEDAYFRDPFNEVRGLTAIEHIFDDMFNRLDAPRFHVTDAVPGADCGFLLWDFTFRLRAWRPRTVRTIHGCTHLRFAPDGRVARHRDYWDAASELYVHLPLIGVLMRALRRRMA